MMPVNDCKINLVYHQSTLLPVFNLLTMPSSCYLLPVKHRGGAVAVALLP